MRLWSTMLSGILLSCNNPPAITPSSHTQEQKMSAFNQIPNESILTLASNSEPGTALWLALEFRDKQSGETINHNDIHVYHTASSGDYEPSVPNDESTARLNGWCKTSSDGKILIKTILPGDYGSSTNSRHIHTSVRGAHPEAYDIHFLQYTGPLGKAFIDGSDQHFLVDLHRTDDSILIGFATIEVKNPKPQKLPACEWCGAIDAPDSLHWKTAIAPIAEPGERLVISGTVYHSDGLTPADSVRIYVYNTNAEGIYPKTGDEIGNGKRHGYIRGYVLTDKDGKYRFETIKPSPYPSHNEPAHIHMTLWADTIQEYWINSVWFKGDTLITSELKQRLTRTAGFSNIIDIRKDSSGVWNGTRNIMLDK